MSATGRGGALVRTPRRAARVAVLAPDEVILLLGYDNEEVGPHWAMPGGGLDEGEPPREGALRELHEETGWHDLVLGELLCTWEHDFTRAGVPVRQHEHIYVAQGPRRELGPEVAEAHAADGILGYRWWTPAELVTTQEALWPPQLAGVLRAEVRPVHLGFVG
ncbi:NUDIX hydrolase [Streptomyces sp. KLOTTS4A1]|uniref:NUDIX hydrolase n=1 Tax=Streptomyces sp. KLOTTS4A1 TaxID=3390996 RepID=UPI0039F5F5C0